MDTPGRQRVPPGIAGHVLENVSASRRPSASRAMHNRREDVEDSAGTGAYVTEQLITVPLAPANEWMRLSNDSHGFQAVSANNFDEEYDI